MKKSLFLSMGLITLLVSCDNDSVTQEFNNANGDTAKKLITQVQFDAAQIDEEDYTFTVNYDANNRVTSASNGIETAVLVYQDDQLSTVSGGDEPLSVSELYQDPYDAFETGEVLEYDASGNPVLISVYEVFYDYNYDTGEYEEIIEEYTASITYDAAPNPFFYTFEAAGLIKVMDRVQLNFSLLPQSPEIIKARALFPLNNIKSMIYRDEVGDVVGELRIDYVYDADNYPTSATFTSIEDGDPSSVYSATYSYK